MRLYTPPKPIPTAAQVAAIHAKRTISADEQRRLYELSMRGVDAKISESAYLRSPNA